MEGERKRVHKATAGMTVAQKLERKRASSRRSNLCRVRLGEHLKRWNRLKQEHGVSTDIDMAKILLDSFEAEEAVQTQPLTAKLNTSTPSQTATIVKEEHDYGSDVSDISTLTCPSPACSPSSYPSSSKETKGEPSSPSVVAVVDCN
ncbi:uncharacterized protein [Apostichopus japonicus]|uniref:uncharacterized protein n=1 Tax=Stichopus japonicus TaxID=307972 RepID=UPI003AB65FAB